MNAAVMDNGGREERIRQLFAVLAREVEGGVARAEVLALLIEEFTLPMYSLAYRIVGNVEDTKDVVAEATAKFIFKFDVSRVARVDDPAAAIGAFLRTTTRNAALDLVRRHSRFALISEFEDTVIENVGLSAFDASLIRDAVANLDSVHRDVVMLRYFQDLTLVEVAAALGVSLTTVKNRLRGALLELKRLLDDNDGRESAALSA